MSKSKNVLLIGCTGFIGRGLAMALGQRGYRLHLLSRNPESHRDSFLNSYLYSDYSQIEEKNFQGVFNLAGSGIADARWSPERKKNLLDSRVRTTEKMVQWLLSLPEPPVAVIQGSAIGYYGFDEEKTFIESDPPSPDFLGSLAQAWEAAARPLEEAGIRVCYGRTSLVLGRGGALRKMLSPFQWGLGGRLGSGRQWMSWIHYEDEVGALVHLLEEESCHGAYNLAAPEVARNLEFTKELGRALSRPALLPVPAWALKLLLGEMSCLLLQGTRADSGKLLESGYEFQYPRLSAALGQLCSQS